MRKKCLIWSDCEAEIRIDNNTDITYVKNSARVGCDYSVDSFALVILVKEKINDSVRDNLVKVLRKESSTGIKFPMITTGLITRCGGDVPVHRVY